MSGDEIRAIVREVIREELQCLLAHVSPASSSSAEADLLDLAQAARRLCLGKSTVRKLAAKCQLASVKPGRRLLFKPADLDAYAESRRRSPEAVRALADRLTGAR